MGDFLSQLVSNWLYLAAGALAGAALSYGWFAVREFPRWRYRRQRQRRIAQGDLTALSEPKETEEYLPHAPDEEEREGLSFAILGGAFWGVMVALLFVLDFETHQTLFVTVMIVFVAISWAVELYRLIFGSNRGTPLQDGGGDRRSQIKLTLAFGVLMLTLPALTLLTSKNGTLASLGFTPQQMFQGFWFAAAVVAAGYWAIICYIGPPDDLLEGELGDWNREKDFMLMGAIGLLIFGLLAVVA